MNSTLPENDVRNTGLAFEYLNVPINKIEVELVDYNAASPDEKRISQGSHYLFHGGKLAKAIIIDGQRFTPTGRFWDSLYARFNLNTAFFKFFDHKEVFARVADKATDSRVRVCIERNTKTGDARLLAATGLKKPVLIYDDLMELLEKFNAEGGITYSGGIVTSTHSPRVGANPFNVGGDMFQNKFTVHAPIDGYGDPNFYLSLLRLVCSNGMTALANSFKTSLKLGTSEGNVAYTLQRALEGFQNEEGYAVLRDRFEMATTSWASLREQQELYNMLINLQRDPKLAGRSEIMKAYEDMTGRPIEMYKTDPALFTEKRIRTLPVACKVYDLMNFATEVATHKVSTDGNRKLQAWVGTMLSGDYDLENSCDQFDDFKALFLSKNRQAFADSRSGEDQETDYAGDFDEVE